MIDLRDVRTEAVEDLLKAVFTLQKQADPVPTTLLAKTLNISAPSVTDMVKRLAEPTRNHPALLEHRPYHGVRLTALGEQLALEVIRHHRLLELYLSQALGYSWDEVHNEADRLEHVISEQLEARIAAALGNPVLDPHGDPIPAADGTMTANPLTQLLELRPGQAATISRITDQSPEVLRYLSELGLMPGTRLRVADKSPLGDTITLHVADSEYTISAAVAVSVLVQQTSTPSLNHD